MVLLEPSSITCMIKINQLKEISQKGTKIFILDVPNIKKKMFGKMI